MSIKLWYRSLPLMEHIIVCLLVFLLSTSDSKQAKPKPQKSKSNKVKHFNNSTNGSSV